MSDDLGFTTRALNPGPPVGQLRSEPLSTPIYQAATFAFDDMEHFAAVAKSKTSGGYLYSRWANPTVDALGHLVAVLEGAEAGACFASGMGAISAVLGALTSNGDHIVGASQLYGGSHSVLARVLPRAGVDSTLVDITDVEAVADAFRDETKILYCETIGNPTLPVAELDALARVAHERGALFVADATFTPPCLLRPLAHGVDVSVHSATKYLAGHSDVTAGVVSGSLELIERIRMHAIDTGPVLAPIEAWLTLRGVQTLDLRVERICSNAIALARLFESNDAVVRVFYPKLESHPQYGLARTLLPRGGGGMVAVEVDGGVEGGRRVMERLKIAKPAASLGSTHTLVVHPASVTHTQLSRADREAVGVSDGLLRISVGIEDVDDLLADFEQALA